MNDIHAILFDIGGVILRHPKSPNTTVFAKIFGRPHDEMHKFYDSVKSPYLCGMMDSSDFVRLFIAEFHSPLSVAQVIRRWQEEYEILRSPDPRMLDILGRLRGVVIRAAFSNTTPVTYDVNERSGIFRNFEQRYLSFRLGIAKPDPRVYRLVLEEMRLTPEKILFIDDRPENLPPAASLSMHTIHFDILEEQPHILEDRLRALGIGI